MTKTRRRLAPIPRIRTKTITAADLLRRIRDIVLEEPKRLDMDRWVTMFRGSTLGAIDDRRVDKHGPACGTVGCIAGWGAVLLRQAGANVSDLRDWAGGCQMRRALGLWDYSNREGLHTDLFVYNPSPEFNEKDRRDRRGRAILGGRPGTKAHARAVARRINIFLKAHPEMETRIIQVRP